MLIRKLVLGFAAAGLLAGAAAAADMPVKVRPVAVESWNWTGFYGGLHAGFAWGVFRDGDPITCPTTTCTPAASAINDLNRLFGADSLRKSGFEGGGQLGFNYQMGSIVAGVEVSCGPSCWVRNLVKAFAGSALISLEEMIKRLQARGRSFKQFLAVLNRAAIVRA